MRALVKAKRTAKRSVGGPRALKLQRQTNQRSHIVRNEVKREGIAISPVAPVFAVRNEFAFEKEDRKDLYFLPVLGYAGKKPEVELIQKRVIADMSVANELKEIRALLSDMKPKVDKITGLETTQKGLVVKVDALQKSVNQVLKFHGLPPTP